MNLAIRLKACLRSEYRKAWEIHFSRLLIDRFVNKNGKACRDLWLSVQDRERLKLAAFTLRDFEDEWRDLGVTRPPLHAIVSSFVDEAIKFAKDPWRTGAEKRFLAKVIRFSDECERQGISMSRQNERNLSNCPRRQTMLD